MKTALLFLISLAASSSAFAGEVSFACSAANENRWSTYYCAYGTLSADGNTITDMTFGTCEGSRSAQEEEPVDVYEFAVVSHDPSLAAKSAQWKNAGAFDVTTEGHGPAVFYFKEGSEVARLKVGGKDVRLECGWN